MYGNNLVETLIYYVTAVGLGMTISWYKFEDFGGCSSNQRSCGAVNNLEKPELVVPILTSLHGSM